MAARPAHQLRDGKRGVGRADNAPVGESATETASRIEYKSATGKAAYRPLPACRQAQLASVIIQRPDWFATASRVQHDRHSHHIARRARRNT